MTKILFYIIKMFYAAIWIGDVLDFPILNFMDTKIPINFLAWTILIIVDWYISSIIIASLFKNDE